MGSNAVLALTIAGSVGLSLLNHLHTGSLGTLEVQMSIQECAVLGLCFLGSLAFLAYIIRICR